MANPNKTPVTLNFSKGLNQKVDPRQLQFTNFVELNDSIFTKAGLLQKRNGFPLLSTDVLPLPVAPTYKQVPANISSGNTVSSFNNELLENDGMSLYSRAEDGDNWVYKGRAESCQATKSQIFQNELNNLTQDSAINDTLGISVYAWESWTNQPNLGGILNGVQFSVIDNSSGQTILWGALSSTTSRPKCVSISNKLYILYYDTADNKLHAVPITEGGPGAAIVVLTNINHTTVDYDALVNNSLIYIAYTGTQIAAVDRVNVASFTSAMVAVASVAKPTELASNGVCLFNDAANNIWVAYNNGTETKAFIMNSALSVTVLAPTIVDSSAQSSGVHNVTGIFDGTRGIIFFDKPGDLALAQPSAIDTAGNIVAGFNTNASFTQPAVGSTVAVTINTIGFTQVGAVVNIPGGGYYYCEAQVVGSPTIILLNLGLPGNASPGATVGAVNQIIYPTNGYLNSSTSYNTLTSLGVVGTSAFFLKSCGLASRAFLQNGFAHVILAHDATLQPTYFVCSLYNVLSPTIDAHVLAKLEASEGGGLPYRSLLPNVNTLSIGVYQCALLQRTFFIQNTSNNVVHDFWFTGVVSNVIDTTKKNLSSLTLGRNFHFGSGTLLMYDGLNVVEHNFHLFPENLTFTNGGTGALTAGVYSYVAVYSWIDNQGQLHRSAPSIQVSLTCTGGSENTIILPTLRVTEKNAVTIELYRTQANGTVFFRIDTLFLPPAGTQYPIENSTLVDSITIVEGRADADISGNKQLYTTGEVENIAAPAVLCMFEYNNRVVLIPSVDPTTWWYSKQVFPGSPVEFSDVFVKNVGTVGGDLTGGLRMDDKIILGKAGLLYYVTGNGPAASGANDDFSDPIFITSDVGITNFQSMVFSQSGIFFKSSKGIYRLGRDLSVNYAGAAVEGFNSQEVLAAQLIPTTYQLRFILSGGFSLMYDYFFDQWGVFSKPDGISDCIHQNKHTYLDASGVVYQELDGTYVDGAATPVLMSFKTANLNMAGIVGYERIYDFVFLAQYLSAHRIQLQITYDYLALAQSATITPTSSALEQWRVHAKRQLCQAFQITLNELDAGTPGAAFSMSGITFNLGIKKGVRPIKGAAAAGFS